MTRHAARRHGERGETLVEFAFSAVLFLTLLFGTIEFGIAIYRYNIVSDLAQEGARWASVRGGSSGAVAHAVQNDVLTYITSRAPGLSITSVSTTSANDATKVCSGTATDPKDVDVGDTLCVTVTSNFSFLTGLLPRWTLPLRSTAQMIMSR